LLPLRLTDRMLPHDTLQIAVVHQAAPWIAVELHIGAIGNHRALS